MSARLLKIQDWEKLAREAAFQPAVMAALCPVSLRQMQRFFIEQFEKTPREWARELRCRLARQLISEGWSSKAVALELHFASESHFCHEFKRVYGVCPQTFAPLYGAKDTSRTALPTLERSTARKLTSSTTRQALVAPACRTEVRQTPEPYEGGSRITARVAFRQ